MSSLSQYQTLLNRGRKAGLNTRDLYRALATLPVENGQMMGQSDCNGYVQSYTQQGHSVYLPQSGRRP